jgi:predicted glycosyltransferase
MKIMVGVGHPKGVHFWKNIIHNLESDGHEVKIVAREKDITLHLLNAYGFEYEVIGKNYKGLIKKAYGMLESDLKMLKVAKEFKPDILASGAPYLAHVSKLIGKPYIGFSDTEHARLTSWLSFPFADVICTPSCFKKKIDPKKHITFNGYFQLAYLHPNYFKPDPSVLDDLGLSKNDKFIIMRFGSWSATHDTHSSGIKLNSELIFVKSLEQYGYVFITSERALPLALQKYRLNIRPENIHSLLSFAQLYIGEGETMAAESAILGTPAIDIEAITLKQGTIDITAIHGNADELVNKYKLMFAFSDQNKALEKATKLLEDNELKKKWMKKREKLLRDKIDVTAFMTEFIEKYPENFYKYCKNRSEENI